MFRLFGDIVGIVGVAHEVMAPGAPAGERREAG